MSDGTATAVGMAALLAERATALGLNQRQFADLVGASTKHVNLVLNGRVTAHADTLDLWATCLGARFEVQLIDASASASASVTGDSVAAGAEADGAAERVAGHWRSAAPTSQPEPPQVVDLMAALEASLAAVKNNRPGVESRPAEGATDFAREQV